MPRLVEIALVLLAANCILLNTNERFTTQAAPSSFGESSLDDALQGIDNIAHGIDVGNQGLDARQFAGQFTELNHGQYEGPNRTWIDHVKRYYLPHNTSTPWKRGSSSKGKFNPGDFVPDNVSDEDIWEVIQDDNNEPDCMICLSSNSSMELVNLDCGHKFCHTCLKEWYFSGRSNGSRCPLCRRYMSVNGSYISSEFFGSEGVNTSTSEPVTPISCVIT